MSPAPSIRPPAVAGLFYPGDARSLAQTIGHYLAAAQHAAPHAGHAVPPAPTSNPVSPPKAVIVPHAGYRYSGAVAARAYALLGKQVRRVVLLGPCHRVAVRGIAVPSLDCFATPLGDIPLDRPLIDSLHKLPGLVVSDAAHADEHALEVQLPFLQTVLGDFTLVPLAVGQTTVATVAAIIDHLWGGPETLIVISSDLSHFHPYAGAQRIDQATVQQILSLQTLTDHEQACGALPINALLEVLRRRHLSIELLDLCNSGDTAGDKTRVVGYAAFAVHETAAADAPDAPDAAADPLGTALLVRARNAIAVQLGRPMAPEPGHPALDEAGATFVTLTLDGRLRGCIGSLDAHRSLDQDVRGNALAAALRDPRFPPLSAAEFDRMCVEVSLLTAPQAMHWRDEADALAQLRPRVDGLIFSAGPHRATFLPQVWEQLPQPRQFIAQLKQKAGLPADYWSAEVKLSRYQVRKWSETIPPDTSPA